MKAKQAVGVNFSLADFGTKLENFLVAHCAEQYAILDAPKVEIEVGTKYARVVKVGPGGDCHRSAYCFINLASGDILKPASWKTPAKHSRGNVSQSDEVLFGDGKVCGPYGVAYLR